MQNQNNIQTNLEGLGWIAAAISAVAIFVPMIITATKKKPQDEWSSWSPEKKGEYVSQSLIVAKEAVKRGEAQNVEEVLKVLIALVELDESYEEWKQKNPALMPMIAQAQSEIAQTQTQTASLVNGNVFVWAIFLGLAGFAYYKRDWIIQSFSQKQIVA